MKLLEVPEVMQGLHTDQRQTVGDAIPALAWGTRVSSVLTLSIFGGLSPRLSSNNNSSQAYRETPEEDISVNSQNHMK